LKHLVIGDVHGYFGNLREFLIQEGAIDANNRRINKDTLKVYCTGDLIDGHYNREGDLMLLAMAEEWFDAVCIGNHEWAFCGGEDWGGARKRDRDLILGINHLIDKGVYVPSVEVEGHLLVHGGVAARWEFESAKAADKAIRFMWDMAKAEDSPVPLFDWIGPERMGKWGNETGGIFWLDWAEYRNPRFNQVVGHSTNPGGPVSTKYPPFKTIHWNIDVGGKTGTCLGGVVIENGHATPVFWGKRFRFQNPLKEKKEELSEPEYDAYIRRIAERVLAGAQGKQTREEAEEAEGIEEPFPTHEAEWQGLMEEPSHWTYLDYLEDF
jgi:calcineurin-like phosphoesterase family protein